MKKNKLNQILIYCFLLLPFVLIAFTWPQLPDRMPTHWNFRGEIDSYGPRWKIFLLPVVNLGLYALFSVLPKIDPKQNIEQFRKTYDFLVLIITGFMCVIFCIILAATLGYSFEVERIVMFLLVLLLLILGNYMGKMRPNYFMGIRTPWTLESEEVWRRTHLFAGRLWVGAAMILLALLPITSMEIFIYIFLPSVLIMTLVPVAYSGYLYTKVLRSETGENSHSN